MKVFVTGGAGFIGSHVVRLLLDEGIEVRVFDSFVTGKRERVPIGATLIEGDIRDETALDEAMRGMTHVVHLAAQVSVPASVEDPAFTHDVNIVGTRNVLAVARRASIKRLVYASSAAVYGDYPELPKTEKSSLRPQSPYATSKVANEADALASGLSTIGLRFFNVYGPGQEANHPYASVIPRWVEAVREGRSITLYGDGKQTRDFVHVSDVARAIRLALAVDVKGIFNIASGEEISLAELRQLIADIYPRPFETIQGLPRAGDIMRSVADISAARNILGFTPSVKFREGLSKLLAS